MVEDNKTSSFTLVLGGVRSGKSSFALKLCEAAEGPRVYLATATALDAEMARRIERHKRERANEWATVEEPIKAAEVLSATEQGSVVLIDCLTLWLTNLMGLGLGDDEILERVDGFTQVIGDSQSAVVAVSNEVGQGIMPVNAMARRFADLSGFMNQSMASVAEEVFFMRAGIPTRLK